MKTLFLTRPKHLEYRADTAPKAPPGWARVRMRTVGICGSDIHYFVEGRIGDQVCAFPHILGHEGSGEVIEGAGRFAAGTPVYVEPAIVCHACDQCLAGRENTCRKIQFFGNPHEYPGCMREEITLPAENVVPLPKEIPPREGFLLEPLAIGAYAVARSPMRRGATAAIVGGGPIGLSVLAALEDLAPQAVFVSDPVAPRRAAAETLGAHHTVDPAGRGAAPVVQEASGGGVDVAYECAGTQEAIDDAIRMLKPGGALLLIGIPEGGSDIRFNHSHMRRNEITLVNVRRQNRMTERAMEILRRRRDLERILVTHRFRPEQANEAFTLVHERRDGVIKAVLDF